MSCHEFLIILVFIVVKNICKDYYLFCYVSDNSVAISSILNMGLFCSLMNINIDTKNSYSKYQKLYDIGKMLISKQTLVWIT